MKLATYKDGSRDGQLVVVSRDLSIAHYATGIASRPRSSMEESIRHSSKACAAVTTAIQASSVRAVALMSFRRIPWL